MIARSEKCLIFRSTRMANATKNEFSFHSYSSSATSKHIFLINSLPVDWAVNNESMWREWEWVEREGGFIMHVSDYKGGWHLARGLNDKDSNFFNLFLPSFRRKQNQTTEKSWFDMRKNRPKESFKLTKKVKWGKSAFFNISSVDIFMLFAECLNFTRRNSSLF